MDWTDEGEGETLCGEITRDADLIVALPHPSFGTGDVCNHTITIALADDSASELAGVRVVDQCPSTLCGQEDILVSPAVFGHWKDLNSPPIPVVWDWEG